MLYAKLIFFALLLIQPRIAFAQEMNLEAVNGALLNWFERADSKPHYMYEEGQRILEFGRLNGNCDSIVLGSVLMLRACNNAPGTFTDPVWDALGCEWTGQLILEELAYKEFLEGRIERAVATYKRALSFAEDPRSRVKLMQAIGTCFMQTENPDSAVHWYKVSADFGLEHLTAINFSNISNAYLGAENPSESIIWSKRAESKLLEEFQSGLSAETFAKRLDLILNNQVLALVDLGDLDAAEQTFQRMSLEAFYPNMAAEFYHLSLILAWAINDSYPVEIHRSAFERELIVDSLGAVGRFGPTLALIDPWRQAWEAEHPKGSSVWLALRELPDDLLPELRQSRSAHSSAAEPIQTQEVSAGWTWAAMGFAFGFAFFLMEWRNSRRGEGGVGANLVQMRNFLLYPESRTEREAIRAFNGLQELAAYPDVPSNLNVRDVDVLMSMLRNERPKETAARLEISTKSVYMIRSEIKKKIGLNGEESLGDWLAQFKKSNPS